MFITLRDKVDLLLLVGNSEQRIDKPTLDA